MTSLSLGIIPYIQISQDDASQLEEVDITLFFAYGKNPRKANFEITVVIEDIPQQTVSISGQNLTSVVSWYNYILNTTGIKSKYILFAKSQDHNIGSGFVSNSIHFASFLIMGIREFLLVKLNEYVFGRLISGKTRLPDELIAAMNSSTNGATTVDDVINHQRNEEENTFLEMRNRVNNLQTETVNQIPQTNYENPLIEITVWKRYSALLYSLNNIFFSIDEHFNNISRTTMLDDDIVKEVCTDILNKHKADDSL